jgi:hypothetical protein
MQVVRTAHNKHCVLDKIVSIFMFLCFLPTTLNPKMKFTDKNVADNAEMSRLRIL